MASGWGRSVGRYRAAAAWQSNANRLRVRTLDNAVGRTAGRSSPGTPRSAAGSRGAIAVRALIVDPAGSGAKAQCTGTSGGPRIAAAIAALPVGAPPDPPNFSSGACNLGEINDKVIIIKATVVVERWFFVGVVSSATVSIFSGGVNAEARFRMFTVGRNRNAKPATPSRATPSSSSTAMANSRPQG